MTKTIPIRYVGLKEEETDHLYGTGITWKKGEVHDVPAEKVKFLLNHPDVWEDARSKAAQKKEPVQAEPLPPAYARRPLDSEPLAINLPFVDEAGLRRYAQIEFNENLPEDMPLHEMRLKVQDLIRMRS